MSTRLLLFSRKQTKLKLLRFLKPSLASSSPTTKTTLVPFCCSSSSSSFFRSLSTATANTATSTDNNDWYGKKYYDGDEDDDNGDDNDRYEKGWWDRGMNEGEVEFGYDYWDAEKLTKLFSSTKPPRLPYIFPKKSKGYGGGICTTEIVNPLLRRLYKCGQDNYAKELLDEILDYKEGLWPGTKTLVINEWVKKVKPGEPVDGKYMFDAVSKMCHGCPPCESLSPLVIKLSRCGHADTACDLAYLVCEKAGGNPCFEAMNALLNGLGREKKVDQMKMLLYDMFEGDFCYGYDMSSFRIVVYHLCRLQRVDEALEVIDSLEALENPPYFERPYDLITNNIITKELCNVGRPEEGLALVDRMRSRIGCAPNTVTYNALIAGFCKIGEIERSRKLFDEMNEKRVPANVTTLNTLVAGMCKHGDVSSAFDFFMDMQRKGLKGNATTYNSLITAFCNTKNLDKAMDLFNEMDSSSEVLPNIALYNILIGSLCKEKRTDDALYLMDKMNVKGLFPNVVTYNAIFRGLRDTNSLDEVFKLMDTMKGQACHPNDETMEILSDWLSAEGETTRLKTLNLSV